MQNIIKTSRDLTKVETYKLLKAPDAQKMSDADGHILEIEAWAQYEDIDEESGDCRTILSILTPDGVTYGTNSQTFTREFLDAWDIFGDEMHSIKVFTTRTRANRDCLLCAYNG